MTQVRELFEGSAKTLAPLSGLLAVLILAAITTPNFFSLDVLRLVSFQIGIIGITALGQTFVLLIGGIDLSIAAVMVFTTIVLASYTDGQDGRLPVAILLAIGAGLVAGALNALLVLVRNVPPFVATFASFVLIQGIIVAWTRGAPSGSIPGALSWLGQGRILGLPVPTALFLVMAVAGWMVLAQSGLGRRIYATGLNPTAAHMSGIRTGWVISGCYIAAALSGVLAGLVSAGFIGYVDAAGSRNLDLNSIAAAVIGGVALSGGRGRIGQTVLGVVLLAVLLTWLIQLGAGAGGQLVVSGSVILLAVALQNGRFRLPSPIRTFSMKESS
jgi:ribose transport system permease protein